MDNLKWLQAQLRNNSVDKDFLKGVNAFCKKVDDEIVSDEAERIANDERNK